MCSQRLWMWSDRGCELIWTLLECRGVWSWVWKIYKYLQSHRLEKECEGLPFPRPRTETARKKEWMKKLYECKKKKKMKQWDLPERCAAAGQRKRTTGFSGEQEGGRDRESKQRTRDPPSRGERPSEWGGQGCAAWLCSPLGGAHSPCGEPAAEPEQEGSGDTERPRHDESKSECERTSKRAWEQKWTVLVCLS